MRKIFFSLLLSFLAMQLLAQSRLRKDYDPFALGIGLGLDYGGLGGNLLVSPHQNVGLFLGGGYTMAGFGYNAGAKFFLASRSADMQPYLIGMYGYNAAIAANKPRFDKLFYGPSIGVGLDRDSKRGNGYWSYSILFSLKSSDVDNYTNSLKTQNAQYSNNLPPIAFTFPLTFSIGYHFVIQ